MKITLVEIAILHLAFDIKFYVMGSYYKKFCHYVLYS